MPSLNCFVVLIFAIVVFLSVLRGLSRLTSEPLGYRTPSTYLTEAEFSFRVLCGLGAVDGAPREVGEDMRLES